MKFQISTLSAQILFRATNIIYPTMSLNRKILSATCLDSLAKLTKFKKR